MRQNGEFFVVAYPLEHKTPTKKYMHQKIEDTIYSKRQPCCLLLLLAGQELALRVLRATYRADCPARRVSHAYAVLPISLSSVTEHVL